MSARPVLNTNNNIVVTITSDFDAIADVWRDLQPQCELTIYQDYGWQRAWFEAVGVSQGHKCLFVTGYCDNQPIFLIPLTSYKTMGMTIATWMGGDHANYRMGLFHKDHLTAIQETMEDLVHWFCADSNVSIDVLNLTQQPLSWAGKVNPIVSAQPHTKSAVTGGGVSLDKDFDVVLQRGNAKRKRKILRGQERDLEALGGYSVERTKTLDENNDLYDTFLDQKEPWFKERGIESDFADKATIAFFKRLGENQNISSEKITYLHYDYIKADGVVLALLGNGIFRGCSYGYFTSIHPAGKYQKLSPGALSFYKAIEKSCAQGLCCFDFGVGAERYKKSWCDKEHELADVRLAVTTAGKLYVSMETLKNSAKRQIKENDALWSVVKRLRRNLVGSKAD